MSKNKKTQLFGRLLKVILSIVLTMLLLTAVAGVFWLVWTKNLPYPDDVTDVEKRGQFGDSFGVITALFGALGFAGILATLWLQQRQMNNNAREQEVSQFENLLFRLLDFYKASVEAIQIRREEEVLMGREALSRCLQDMQAALKSRRFHFLPEKILNPVKQKKANEIEERIFNYVAYESSRVIQYKIPYQRKMLASLRVLLNHLETRCPKHADVSLYRDIVISQIAHIEVQYIFALMLIYQNETSLRKLLKTAGIFERDSRPYNFKFHQFLYKHFWGIDIGAPELARKVLASDKRAETARQAMKTQEMAEIMKKLKVGAPMNSQDF